MTDKLHPVGNQIIVENDVIRAWLIDVAPGDSLPLHHHLNPYLLVNLTDGQLRVDSPRARPMDRTLHAGTVEWHDSEEIHSFQNQGTGRYKNIIVEVKRGDDLTSEQ
jgi:beta-alanine degradation protein BauB